MNASNVSSYIFPVSENAALFFFLSWEIESENLFFKHSLCSGSMHSRYIFIEYGYFFNVNLIFFTLCLKMISFISRWLYIFN